jgi:hypothetical protein
VRSLISVACIGGAVATLSSLAEPPDGAGGRSLLRLAPLRIALAAARNVNKNLRQHTCGAIPNSCIGPCAIHAVPV